jgi:hypothetical protein
MDERLRRQVRERADSRCEYCLIVHSEDVMPFQVDHIIAEVHHGASNLDNLAWTCFDCNVFKGPNIAGIDPDTHQITRLFHPRHDNWNNHFQWSGARLLGKSPQGRATIDVLRINLPERVAHRQLLEKLREFDSG